MLMKNIVVLGSFLFGTTAALAAGKAIRHPSCNLNVVNQHGVGISQKATQELIDKGYFVSTVDWKEYSTSAQIDDLVLMWGGNFNSKDKRLLGRETVGSKLSLQRVISTTPQLKLAIISASEKSKKSLVRHKHLDEDRSKLGYGSSVTEKEIMELVAEHTAYQIEKLVNKLPRCENL